ncbi:MAG: YihY/virulence factor BrkB family protein [Gemmatimonadota bacterium]
MTDPDFLERAERWATGHTRGVAGVRLGLLAVRFVRSFAQTRVMGLAAEMAYYAVLSVFPLIGALGVSLGFLQSIVGAEAVDRLEDAVILSLNAVFSPAVMNDVITPLIQGLLQQERAGFAVGSFVLTLLLASRVFRSAIDTLDAAYQVDERRGVVSLWMLGLLFAVGAIITATTMLTMVVVGPLLGGARAIADALRLGAAFEFGWAVARWPAVIAVATGFLTVLYRSGPNVKATWRQSVPGAVFGVVALILVAIGFRVYLEATGVQMLEIPDAEEAVVVAGQVVGAVLAALLWLWLSGMAVLSGGVLNAELSRLRHDMPEQKVE